MTKFIYKSAHELATLIRNREATSADIVKEHLAHIKANNSKTNALISVFEDEALETANELDIEAQAGNFRGPLHGVPVTIKEQFWIKGKKSNTNFKMLKDFVAPQDAVIVKRIRNAGAVILGQTNVPRNLTDYQVNGDIYPEGKNPFNLEYSPGGSTGGGAAALASGFTPLELGGDFGGSVRVPSNFCGLYGLKPTENTVPLHGNIPLPKDANTFLVHMVQAGPLARNIEDIELLWKIIVGPHEGDRNISDINWKEATQTSIADFKIAWTDGWPGYQTSSEISTMISEFANKLGAQGCSIAKRIPDESIHRDSLEVYVSIFPYVVAQGAPWLVRQIIRFQLGKNLLSKMKTKHPHLMQTMKKGFKMNANHYGEAMLNRNLLIERWENFLNEYDFIVCPVAFGPAFKRCKIGTPIQYDGKELLYAEYVWPFAAWVNASGNPSLAIPLGLSKEGLPVGVQVVGRYWSEPKLIQFAKLASQITPGFIKPKSGES